MNRIRAAIVGYGNIGRYALEALEKASDMECVGIVRRSGNADGFPELAAYKVTSDISELGKVDVAMSCQGVRSASRKAARPTSFSAGK